MFISTLTANDNFSVIFDGLENPITDMSIIINGKQTKVINIDGNMVVLEFVQESSSSNSSESNSSSSNSSSSNSNSSNSNSSNSNSSNSNSSNSNSSESSSSNSNSSESSSSNSSESNSSSSSTGKDTAKKLLISSNDFGTPLEDFLEGSLVNIGDQVLLLFELIPAPVVVDPTFTVGDINVAPSGGNLAEEWIEIVNTSSVDALMTGYSVVDAASHDYSIPNGFVLKSGSVVKIRTGNGVDDENNLYMNKSRAVWNNSGDVIYLIKGNDIVMQWGYGKYSDIR